jgi:hypothetical protein
MIHVLNNLPSDYDLQVALLERRIGDEKDPLTVSEIRSELSLRFERLLFIADNSKENVEIAAKSDINCSNVKIEEIKMAVVTVEMRVEVFIALIVASLDM